MDYEEWIKIAVQTIKQLRPGDIFLLKDLFEGCKWNALPKGERLKFGGYFKKQVELKKIADVEYFGKAKNNSAQYKKMEEK